MSFLLQYARIVRIFDLFGQCQNRPSTNTHSLIDSMTISGRPGKAA